jgi:SsrA-binding protein
MKVIATNKKASHDYYILDTYEAGIVLQGTEIKSVRANKVNIKDAYCLIKEEQLFVINMHIAQYKEGNIFNHNETRTRKLLMHKREIIRIFNKIQGENLTIIPTKVYLDHGLCKVEIAIAKGKKQFDKRQALKEKDAKRTIEKNLKNQYDS